MASERRDHISVGDTFASFEELEEKLNAFQKNNYIKLWRRNSMSIERALRIAPKRHLNDALKYASIVNNCNYGGRR